MAGADSSTKSIKPKTEKFYGVRRGRIKGVFTDWPTVQQATTGYHMPEFKAFTARQEAEDFVRGETLDSITEPVAKKSKTIDDMPPGYGPLPAGAQDGFDNTLTLDEATGEIRQKTIAEMNATKAMPRSGPASGGEWIEIWTDGACRSNGKLAARAGVGVYFGNNDPRNLAERLPGERQTNQRAELMALKRALEMCPYNRNARIISDSNYAIKCVTEWFKNWEKNGWKNSTGKVVDNRDIIEDVLKRIRERESCKSKSTFEWVKGHSDNAGNNAADILAVKGSMLPAIPTPSPHEELSAPST